MVLLVAHEPAGAMGVVLNRATEIPVAEVLGEWAGLARHPAVLFEGGPVQPDSAICVARARPGAGPVEGFQPFFGAARHGRPVPGADGDAAADRGGAGVRRVRRLVSRTVGGGDRAGSWFTFDALPGDPFVDRPDDLWSLVLRRQGGLVAAVAHYPPDPSLN